MNGGRCQQWGVRGGSQSPSSAAGSRQAPDLAPPAHPGPAQAAGRLSAPRKRVLVSLAERGLEPQGAWRLPPQPANVPGNLSQARQVQPRGGGGLSPALTQPSCSSHLT